MATLVNRKKRLRTPHPPLTACPRPRPALQLHTVAAVIGRALLDHQRRLARSAGPEAALFARLPLDAVEAKLESVKQQVGVVCRELCMKEGRGARQRERCAHLGIHSGYVPPQPLRLSAPTHRALP